MPSPTNRLNDCVHYGEGTELLIVEGDSAGRAVCRLRDPNWQAVFPMQGKPMNATKASWSALSSNPQFAALLSALCVASSPPLDRDAIPYKRIILLFDQDADGIHSRTLMWLFFDQYLPSLLEAGRVYDAHAPMWVVTSDQFAPALAYTDSHFQKIKRALHDQGISDFSATRFRGLASVDETLLHRLCLDPNARRLTTLSRSDVERARELLTAVPLGSQTPSSGEI